MSQTENSEITIPMIQREEMDVDVLIVGGGSAGLSCAIQLKKQVDAHNLAISEGKAQGEPLDPMRATSRRPSLSKSPAAAVPL